MTLPVLDFFFEFASPYSYLSAARIGPAADAEGVAVRWRPFLLGPIFHSQGWDTSPFNLYPAKGRYLWRDMERRTQAAGLAFVKPDPFPQNGLLAARAVLALPEEARPAATRAIFAAGFGEGRQLAEPDTIRDALTDAGLDGDAALAAAASEPVKSALRANTDAAVAHGIFGAPSFVAPDGEMFWGDDHLEEALRWTVGQAATGF